jgi:Cytochrome C assembly protein
MAPDLEITNLMPAMHSICLQLPKYSEAIACAIFLVAFLLTVLYLFRDKLPMPNFFAAAGVLNILAIALVTRGQVFMMRCPLIESVVTGGKIEKAMNLQINPPTAYRMELPGLGTFLFITIILFAISVLTSWKAAKTSTAQSTRKATLFFIFPMILYLLACAHLLIKSGRFPGFHLHTNIYALALLALTWTIGALTLMLAGGGDWMREKLPKARVLDGLTYKSILAGFSVLFFAILSGAILAKQTQGRYWDWGLKETASLITFIVYLIYLYTRIAKSKAGRRSAYLAILGGACVLFTYLGVNLIQ